MGTVWMVLLACGGSGAPSASDEEPVTVVQVQPVERGTVVEQIATTAVVEAERAADLVPVAAGTVIGIYADEGDPVRRGELLAELESVSLRAGVERTRAEVRRLEQRLGELERLHARGAVASREVEDLRHRLRVARIDAREAAHNGGKTRIVAPFDGVVARRDVRIGELAEGKRAFQVVDLDALLVRVELPERDLGRVEPGQPVVLRSAYDPELEGRGVVERLAPVVDPVTGTFRVTVEVVERRALRPGQFVNVQIGVDAREDVLVVPRRALLWEAGRAHVFVMDGEEGVARRRAVEIGMMDEERAEVLAGLEEGEAVVVLGQSHLRDGARIRAAGPGGGG